MMKEAARAESGRDGRAPTGRRTRAATPARHEESAPAPHRLLTFALGDQCFGLGLASVEQVLRVVEIVPLPGAPDIVLGFISLRGRILPVFDVRRRFGLPARNMTLNDHLIVARTARRPVVLLVDRVGGVVERPDAAVVTAQEILPDMAYVAGIAKLDDGEILIHDLDAFLSLDEGKALDAAVDAAAEGGDGA